MAIERETVPTEARFDFICDRLLTMDMLPSWVETGDEHSTLTLTRDHILWALHYMKSHGEWNDLIQLRFEFSGDKDGSYIIRKYPEWLVGDYTWSSSTGLLFFTSSTEEDPKTINISDVR